MKYRQNLPYYKHDFKHAEWIERESVHYVFHYMKNSVAERDIGRIVSIQEKSHRRISAFLRLSPSKKFERISYYFYPNKKVKKSLMGDDWFAQSICDEMTVHMLYTSRIKPIGAHEDTHLLSLPFGFPIGFIQEGFAEYMTGHDWYGGNLRKTAERGIRKGLIKLDPQLLYSHSFWRKINEEKLYYYYALAGSFVDFLVGKYGRNKFLKLYGGLRRNRTVKNKELYFKIFKESCDVLLERCYTRKSA